MRTRSRRTGQGSSRSGAAREPPQQQLPDDIEKENAAVLDKLPPEVWEKVVRSLRGENYFPFAMTCRYFRDLRQDAEALALERVTDPRDAPNSSSYSLTTHTTLMTTLQSYTYIDTHDFGDMLFPATIEYEFCFDDVSLDSAEYMKWLFREVRRASCEWCGEWQLRSTGEKVARRGKKWDVAKAEQNLMELAAIKGDLDLIKWLRSQDPPCEWSKKACTAAAWANRWDLLRHLLSMGCSIDKGGMLGVAALDPGHSLPDTWDGKFEILKWLQREHGCTFSEDYDFHVAEVVYEAVKNDDLECLDWVLEQGVTWKDIVYGLNQNGTWYGAAALDLLREEEVYEMNLNVCWEAANLGRLQILQYAVKDGCPWIPEKCLEAAEKNEHDHVVKWITDNPHLYSPQFSDSDLDDSESESDSLSE